MRVRVRSMVAAMAVAAALAPAVASSLPAAAQLPPPGSAQSWFFAEGNTLPNWFEFITVINPDPNADITIAVEYQLEEPAGFPAGTRTRALDVPRGERRTLSVYDDLGRAPGAGPGQPGVYTGVSARLTSTANFVAERPMYFINNFDVGEVNGAHDALGVNAASRTWYFAEGSTLQSPAPDQTGVTPGAAGQLRGFMPFFTMQNVSGQNATVTITYRTNNPDQVVEKTIAVPNSARITTDIANAFNNPAYPGSLGPGFEGFGTSISSDQPIIVERPFYSNREFPGIGLVNAASDERGALTADTTTRLFAEGTVLDGFFEFITVFNPNVTDTVITLDYQIEGQTTPVVRTLAVPALSRRTVQVYNEASEGGLGRTLANSSAPGSAGVSVAMTSTNGVGFVAERPMYFIRDFGNGPINGSHDVLGAGVADTSWFFAEGTLRNGFFEFITIQNPNAAPATARLDYFINDQPLQTNFRALPANSRVTVVAFDPNSEGSLAQRLSPAPVPADVDFGLRVTSVDDATLSARPATDAEIVVERPIYVNAIIAGQPPAINGGHNTLGFQFPAGEVPTLPGQTPETGSDVEMISKTAATTGTDEVTYTITIRNNGPDTATGVIVDDDLPPATQFVRDASTAPAQCRPGSVGDPDDPDRVNCIPNGSVSLADGETATMVFVARVTCPGPATRTNSATVNAVDDIDASNNSDTADITVSCPAAPALEVAKTDSANSVPTNTEVTYGISVDNTGDLTATNVVISDTLPAGATLVRAPGCTSDGDGTITCTIGTLAPGDGDFRDIVVTYASAGTYTNNASATSAEGASAADSETTTVTGPQPALDLDKSGPATANVNQDITYMFQVSNTVPGSTATNVEIVDTLPAGVTFVSGSACTSGDGQVTCTIGTLTGGQTVTTSITVHTGNTPDTITNTATASSDEGASDTDTVVTTLSNPLTLTKTDNEPAGGILIGSELTYTLTVTTPAGTFTNVRISDTLPAGATFVSSNECTQNPLDATNIICNFPEISTTLGVARIGVTFAGPPRTATNVATVTSDQGGFARDTEETEVVGPLSIHKTDENDPADVGEVVTYTLTTFSNQGTLNNVVLTDTLPGTAEFVGASANCSQAPVGGQITCTLGSVAAGTPEVVTITVTFNTAAGSPFTNRVDGTADGGISATDSEQTAVNSPITLDKTDSDDPVFAGDEVTYTLDVTNQSLVTVNDVVVTDSLPAGANLVRTGGGCTMPLSGTTVTCTIASIAAGDTQTAGTVTVTFSISGATITNTATATSTAGGNAQDSEGTEVLATADLALGKVFVDQSATEVTFTVTLTNTGPDPATNITFRDNPESNLDVLRTSSGCTIDGNPNTATCSVSNLAVNGTEVFTIVIAQGGGATRNDVDQLASDQFDPNNTNDSANATAP